MQISGNIFNLKDCNEDTWDNMVIKFLEITAATVERHAHELGPIILERHKLACTFYPLKLSGGKTVRARLNLVVVSPFLT